MRICAAQTRPITGDIPSNIAGHKRLLDLAVSGGAELVIFPELSLTGYEPRLARELATDADDGRLEEFQRISDARLLTIGVGLPLRDGAGVSIGMVIFQPGEARQVYAKRYLDSDEEPFFVGGRSSVGLLCGGAKIALAICYELSVPEHAEDAFRSGARIYFASAAKSAAQVERASRRLSEIAREYSMTALMSNCVGRCDNFESAGGSAAWDDKGLLLGRLNDADEGIIVVDTDTQEVFEKTAR
jgi:predicted amidohydrolase